MGDTTHFWRSLCERPPLHSPTRLTVLCPTWPTPNWISADNGCYFYWQCTFPRVWLSPPRASAAASEERSRQGEAQISAPPRKLSLAQRHEQQADHTAMNSPKTPLPITCTGRDGSPVLTKHIRQQYQAQQREGMKRCFSPANCFQSSSWSKWQSSSYCTTDCVVAMKTESFSTLSYH